VGCQKDALNKLIVSMKNQTIFHCKVVIVVEFCDFSDKMNSLRRNLLWRRSRYPQVLVWEKESKAGSKKLSSDCVRRNAC
jgi:hypothetical protein